MQRHNAESISAELRMMICMLDSDEPVVLHESALADQFGVSRTPVRQALQTLSYEQLVSIRSGVGTTVVPLDESSREKDIVVTCVLLGAVADSAMDRALAHTLQVRLMGQAAMLLSRQIPDAETYLKLRAGLLETLVEAVDDTVLRLALKAAYWRLLRWRINSYRENPELEIEWCRQLIGTVLEAASSGSVRNIFEAAALLERAAE
jgi:DNA-binding GntR family transcriptional regulator